MINKKIDFSNPKEIQINESCFRLCNLNYALEDFIEEVQHGKKDIVEVEKIKRNPSHLTESYLFDQIEPFLLPFYG